MKHTKRNREVRRLYKEGLSTYKVARQLGLRPSTVQTYIRSEGLSRPAPGVEYERRVASFLLGRGLPVEHQSYTSPFDLLVGDQRIDVKAAHLSGKWGQGGRAYRFELSHHEAYKQLAASTDFLYLVFLDKPGSPIYSLRATEVTAKRMLTIPSSLNTKYPIALVGHLGEGVNPTL